MLGIVGIFLLFAAVLFGVWNGTMAAVSSALLAAPGECVKLVLSIGGTICFFFGLMKVAQQAGAVSFLSRLLRPLIRRLMPGCVGDQNTEDAIASNIASNFLGLGNAATPFGMKACQGLCRNGAANRSAAMLVILNTCSVQLLPTTAAALRASHGAAAPFDILPQVLLTQIGSCMFGLTLTWLVFRRSERRL